MFEVNLKRSEVFQFTPLREGRHIEAAYSAVLKNISIHAPARGATQSRSHAPLLNKFQFTPLREGRRKKRNAEVGGKKISIHAPARGATRVQR